MATHTKPAMNTVMVIMAHHEAEEVVRRHLPFWTSHNVPLWFFCPTDSVIRTDHPVICVGTKGHHSPMANYRFRELLNLLSKTIFKSFIVMEYDALCLDPQKLYIPPVGGPFFAGNVFRDDSPDRKFEGTTFVHPPLLFNKEWLDLILPVMNQIPNHAELGFWDRYLGLALERANFKPKDLLEGLGFSRNTIEPIDYDEAEKAASKGAIFFHGVKTKECLDAILRGRKAYGN